jgi:DNA-binding NtrC family response regulator
LSKFSNEFQCSEKYIGPKVIKAVEEHGWPGNFRQLESAMMRIFLSTEESILNSPEYLFSSNDYINSEGSQDSEISESSMGSEDSEQILSFSREKSKLINKFEHEYIHKVLKISKGNISKAALIANKERRAFTRLMEKHGVSRKSFM